MNDAWIRLRTVSLLVCSGFSFLVLAYGFIGWITVLIVPGLETKLELVLGMSNAPVLLAICMLATIFFIPFSAVFAAFKIVEFFLWTSKGWQPERNYLKQLLEKTFRRKRK